MQIQEAMTSEVSFCGPETNAAEAAALMWSRDCGILPVIEASGRLAGVVTDRDLFIALGTQNRPAAEVRVGEIMHQEPAVCRLKDDVRHALTVMREHRIHRVPVVDEGGSLKGILSMNDVLLRTAPGKNGVSKDDVIRTMTVICSKPKQAPQAMA